VSDLNPPQLRALSELCSELTGFDFYAKREKKLLSEFLKERSRTFDDYQKKFTALHIVAQVLNPAHALNTFMANPGFVDDVQRFIDELRLLQAFVRTRPKELRSQFPTISAEEYERRLWATADAVALFGPAHLTMQTCLVTLFDEHRLPAYPADDFHAAVAARKRFEDEYFPPIAAARDRFFEDPSLAKLESFVTVAEYLLSPEHPVRELTPPLVREQALTEQAKQALERLTVILLTDPLLAK